MARVAFAIVACMALMMVGVTSAATYTVGDSTGWTVPSTSSVYTTWAGKQTFKVGDVLVFNFGSPHTVAEVSKSDYDSCTTSNPITIKSSGPANMTIASAGSHYYICTFSTHCSSGQKLAVSAASTSSSSPTTTPSSSSPSTSPAPSSDGTTPTTPSTTTTADEPSSSSAHGSSAASTTGFIFSAAGFLVMLALIH